MIFGPVVSVKWSMESDTYGFCFVLIKMGLKEAKINKHLRSYRTENTDVVLMLGVC